MRRRSPAIALRIEEIAIHGGIGESFVLEEIVIRDEAGASMRQQPGHAGIPVHPALLHEALENRRELLAGHPVGALIGMGEQEPTGTARDLGEPRDRRRPHLRHRRSLVEHGHGIAELIRIQHEIAPTRSSLMRHCGTFVNRRRPGGTSVGRHPAGDAPPRPI